jgi:hypothetical protein
MQGIKSDKSHSPAVWDRQVERAKALSGPDRSEDRPEFEKSYFDAMSATDNFTPAPMVELIAAR